MPSRSIATFEDDQAREIVSDTCQLLLDGMHQQVLLQARLAVRAASHITGGYLSQLEIDRAQLEATLAATTDAASLQRFGGLLMLVIAGCVGAQIASMPSHAWWAGIKELKRRRMTEQDCTLLGKGRPMTELLDPVERRPFVALEAYRGLGHPMFDTFGWLSAEDTERLFVRLRATVGDENAAIPYRDMSRLEQLMDHLDPRKHGAGGRFITTVRIS
jgi:hypothetical protein